MLPKKGINRRARACESNARQMSAAGFGDLKQAIAAAGGKIGVQQNFRIRAVSSALSGSSVAVGPRKASCASRRSGDLPMPCVSISCESGPVGA
jgi:hypothetical protein